MSFSSDVKQELSKISSYSNKEIVKFELIGYLISNNIKIDEKNIKFTTENEYNINRFSRLLSNLDLINQKIDIHGKVFEITLKKIPFLKKLNIKEDEISDAKNIKFNKIDETFEKALVRGAFLGGGSINNPESSNLVQITFHTKENAMFIADILKKYNIECKFLKKRDSISMYSKDGEVISNFLAFIGASNSVLKYEEIRVLRDIKNNVNRIVNCESANLNKIVNASLKQIEDIKLIKEKNKFKSLDKKLQDLANLRLANEYASLQELANLLDEKVSKSTVNKRLKEIERFAEELRNL